jgi:hypothetical protein
MMAAEEPLLWSTFILKLQSWVSGQKFDPAICRYDFSVSEDRRVIRRIENGREYVFTLSPQQSIHIRQVVESCGFERYRRGSLSEWRRM